MGDRVDEMVGRRLRRRRRLMGLTQQALGEACGVSFQQIQKYESAQARLSVSTLWKVACALEVDVGYFFSGLAHQFDVVGAEDRSLPAAVQAF